MAPTNDPPPSTLSVLAIGVFTVLAAASLVPAYIYLYRHWPL